ncbi:MAG: DNA methyltransferase [Aristaeellaceae bacterium]
MTYHQFLESKMVIARQSGFRVSPEKVHPALKPHQRDAVIWAVQGGKRALFESFGLGKTVQQLEFCRLVTAHEGGQALIVCPLGVKQEFIRDASQVLGWAQPPVYVRSMAEIRASSAPVLITNYERVRDGDIDPGYFTATSLDEASVLRSFGSKTYQTFLEKFRHVPYKLVCTATPSPNRYKELIHYAGYLDVMDTGQALTRFFQRDSTKANHLTLYPHKEEEFWLWVSTWALCIQRPSDLGYDDTGYDLPPLEVRYHELPVEGDASTEKDGQMRLLRDAALSLRDAAREKRESIPARVAMAKAIVDSDPGSHFILWHDLEDERRAIHQAMPEAVEIYGSQDIDTREKRIIDFAEGRYRLLATKKEISGSGCNFQRHCHRAIFLGIDYEFNDFIQAIYRIYRFLQTEKCIIDIIYMESEREILKALQAKWTQHNAMQDKLAGLIRQFGLRSMDAIMHRMERSIGVERMEVTGRHFRAALNDTIEETARMAPSSVDLIVTSIPFSNHYEYTPIYNDLGHNEDTERFFQQMDYLAPSLLRVLRPGRIFACHVKDRVLFGSQTGTGMPTIEPFHAMTIEHYMRHGFQYMGMITVVTDVVRENNQTYRLGWTEQCKDGTKMGVGCPEYILLFRKLPTSREKAYADTPVEKDKADYTRAQWQLDAHAYWRSSGDRLVTRAEIERAPVDRLQTLYRRYSRTHVYDYAEHLDLARRLDQDGRLPATFMVLAPGSWDDTVWDDISRMRTLNSEQVRGGRQMHLCPLQIDIVDRLITRYSNPGETVYDPFGGLMTVPVEAVKLGREGIGTELNPDYFRDGVGYLKEADAERDIPTLFDLIDAKEDTNHDDA